MQDNELQNVRRKMAGILSQLNMLNDAHANHDIPGCHGKRLLWKVFFMETIKRKYYMLHSVHPSPQILDT